MKLIKNHKFSENGTCSLLSHFYSWQTGGGEKEITRDEDLVWVRKMWFSEAEPPETLLSRFTLFLVKSRGSCEQG